MLIKHGYTWETHHDSIVLSRYIIDYANYDGIPLTIINIDKEKAFDRVSHEYVFRVLKAFGLCSRFKSLIYNIYFQFY